MIFANVDEMRVWFQRCFTDKNREFVIDGLAAAEADGAHIDEAALTELLAEMREEQQRFLEQLPIRLLAALGTVADGRAQGR